SEFMMVQAKALAARIAATGTPGEQDAARIRRAFFLLYARPADEQEVQLGLDFLAAPPALEGGEASALSRWEQYAQVLLGANEFWFVE
ncbi:MAG TPA: hypothetical protein VGX78_09730, partial [Pirellulales bacterium]|nr:hypothetical protein [Pirellulales bacterium]